MLDSSAKIASFVSVALGVVLLLIVFALSFGILKLASLRTMKEALDGQTATSNALSKQMEDLRREMNVLKRGIAHLEFESEKKTRQLATTRRECRLLEDVINLILPSLGPDQKTMTEQAISMLAEIAKSRASEATAIDLWEATQTSILKKLDAEMGEPTYRNHI